MQHRLIFPVFLAVLTAGSVAGVDGPHQAQKASNQFTDVHGCFGDEEGNLEGGIFRVPLDTQAKEFIDAMNLVNLGAVDNRVDLVFVGDGYRGDQMAQFHTDVAGIINSLYQYEPFTSYQSYFRVTEVEVISNQSGVDNDPSLGVTRDTALDMQYWCSGIERLLCVNVSKAYTAAAAAPDIDQVIAVANSTKYGGAGYPSNNLGTTAGGNFAAADITIHELGHSLGNLADEYTYGGPTTYTGPELGPVDVSIYDRGEQISQERKWHNWMDASISGFDNPIGAYEGGNYSQFGVYRPSSNSMMRSLGRSFNLVSAENLIKEIYREVDPIDDGTPDGALLERTDVAWVTPMQPLDHDLIVRWYLDDWLLIPHLNAHSLDISTLVLQSGQHTLRVEVIDGTGWVRDEAMRDQFLTQSREFTIDAGVCEADLVDDGFLNFLDVSQFLSFMSSGDLAADFNHDGTLNFLDVSAFLGLFGAGCP